MVDLPKVPRRLALVEEPKSSLTRADIEAPFATLARGLTDAGEAVTEVAGRLAEDAGYEAVRKDNDGNLIIDRGAIPIVGKAGERFERAAKFTYLSEVQPRIETEMTRLRLAHPNDPDGFDKAAKSYIDTLQNGTPQDDGSTKGGIRDPALRAAVGKIAGSNAAQHYRTALVEQDRLNVSGAAAGFQKSIEGLDNRMAALARQGGVDTDEYRSAQADLRTIYGELQSDKRFKYPPERAQQELEAMADRHRGEAVVGRAMSIYDKATPTSAAEARKFLTEAAWDPGLNLKPAERQQIVARGMAALEGRTAENKALVDANKKLISETIEGLKTSAPYDERRVNDLMARSVAIGDVESYYRLSSYKAFQPWRVVMNGETEAGRVAMFRRLTAPDAGLVDRIVAAESGGDPNAKATTSSATGLGQFTKATWLDMVGRHRPELAAGKTPEEVLALRTDASLSREMVGRLAEENRTRLSAAGVRSDDAAIYLAHFLGPGDAIKVLAAPAGTPLQGVVGQASIEANKGIFTRNQTSDKLIAWAGGKVAGAGQPASNVFFDATRQELVNDFAKRIGVDAAKAVETAETALGKGRTLSPGEIRDISDMIAISGRHDLGQKLDTAAAAYDLEHGLMNQPASVRQALRAQLQATAAQGADPKQRAVIDQAEQTVKALEAGMKETPYSTAAQRGLHQPPGAFDFGNPLAVEVEANKRVTDQQVTRNFDGTGPVSVFEGKEAEGLRTALTQGDPKIAAATLAGLRKALPNDVYDATITAKPVREAIIDMAQGNDPVRVTAAMGVMDDLWKRNPAGFTHDYPGAIKSLQLWQKLRGSFAGEALMERLQRADDPGQAAAREAALKDADKELKSISAANVVSAFNKSWVPFTDPGAPVNPVAVTGVDGLQAERLTGEFSQTYQELRQAGLPKDKAQEAAVERLKATWGPSVIVGGALMRHNPEKYYPMVDGSHAWIKQDVDRLIARVAPGGGGSVLDTAMAAAGRGVKLLAGQPVDLSSTARYTLRTVVADKQTEAEIRDGRPPSYQIVVTDARTGRDELLTDGGQTRFAFDPKPHQEKSRENFGRNDAFTRDPLPRNQRDLLRLM